MTVEDASDADLDAILAIHNDGVARGTAIYTEAPSTLAERREWLDGRRAGGYPVLVARDQRGRCVAYASYGRFRDRSGYDSTVEHTVMVDAEHRGQGLGTALVEALIERAAEQGVHVMVGGIDAANEGSIRMHERLGFHETARMPEVAHKFGRWLDLVLMQRTIG